MAGKTLKLDTANMLGFRLLDQTHLDEPQRQSDTTTPIADIASTKLAAKVGDKGSMGGKIGRKPDLKQSTRIGGKIGGKPSLKKQVVIGSKIGGKPNLKKQVVIGSKIGGKQDVKQRATIGSKISVKIRT